MPARWDRAVRSWALTAMLIPLLAAGCGGDEMSLGEYAVEVEAMVHRMNDRLDELILESESRVPTIDGVAAHYEARAATRLEFFEGMVELEPPGEAADLHEAAISIVKQLADAEMALARRAGQAMMVYELADLMETPEGEAFLAIDEQAVALCRAAQAEMDATEAREMFGDTPWVPAELSEVVLVALKCTAEDRAADSP